MKLFLSFFMLLCSIATVAQITDVRAKRVIADQTVMTNKLETNKSILSSSNYEIIIFPDLQNMSYVGPGQVPTRIRAGREMFDWVRDSGNFYNVKAVIGVGDMTNDANTVPEWDTLAVWYNKLDAVNIPYMTPPGNHDYENRFTMFATGRVLNNYNAYFGASRYASKPYFVDVFRPNKFETSLYQFSAGTRKYAVFTMEMFPTDSAMNWVGAKCDSLWAADPTRQVILTMHAYIRTDGYGGYERSEDGDPSSVSAYAPGAGGVGFDNSGEEVWAKLGKKKPNIRFIFSGHFIRPGGGWSQLGFTTRITSAGDNGNTVDQIMVNYQDATDRGNAYMLRLQFNPTAGTVTAKYWSPYDVDCGGCGRTDPLQPGYTFSDPYLQIPNSAGFGKSVYVNGDLRVDGAFKMWGRDRGFIPFTSFDGEVKTTNDLRWMAGDTAVMLVGNPTYVAGSKVQIAGGLRTDLARVTNLVGMRIPVQSSGGYLTSFSGLRMSGDSARLLIGDPTDNSLSRVYIAGGIDVQTGKAFFRDSVHFWADNVKGNNPFWFRSGLEGDDIPSADGSIGAILRVQATNVIPTEARMWNVIRMRPPSTALTGSYTMMEVGFSTNLYSSTYLKHKWIADFNVDNYFAIDNNYGASLFKVFGPGEVQIGGGNTTARTPSAKVEVISTTQGFLLPRMTTTEKNAIVSPATGLLVYDLTLNKLSFWNGSGWETVTSSL